MGRPPGPMGEGPLCTGPPGSLGWPPDMLMGGPLEGTDSLGLLAWGPSMWGPIMRLAWPCMMFFTMFGYFTATFCNTGVLGEEHVAEKLR